MALEVGVSLPMFLARFGTTLPDLPEVARHAEEIGLDSVWSGDHLSTGTPFLESTVVLSTAAAVTRRVRIGFGVMLLALRQPAWAAKQIGTLQLMSGNRLVLGVGVGGEWLQEWQAAGIGLGDRGRRTDSMLETLPRLLAGEPTRLTTEPGEPEVTLAPAVPMPPVWIGGMSQRALQRAVRHGAGWLGSLLTPAELAGHADMLTAVASEAGAIVPPIGVVVFAELAERDTAGGTLANYLSQTYGLTREHADDVVVSGTAERLAERLHDYQTAGVSQIVVATFSADVHTQYDLVAQARATLTGS